MADEALKNAFAELQHLLDEQGRIDASLKKLGEQKASVDARVDRVSAFIRAWHEFAGLPAPELSPLLDGSAIVPPQIATKVTGNPKKEVVTDAALKFIIERGEPIPRHELYELLKESGLEVKGADPLVTLSTMLWRMRNKIVHFQGKGYWPQNTPYAPIGYNPEMPLPPSEDENDAAKHDWKHLGSDDI